MPSDGEEPLWEKMLPLDHKGSPISTFLITSAEFLLLCHETYLDFAGGRAVKDPPASAGDAGSIPGSGSSPGKGNGNPLQCSCLENSMDRGAWHGVAKSRTQLSE